MEFTDGVVVTRREGIGRVLQATRDFAPSDLVLREESLLRCINGLPTQLVEAAEQLSPEKREQLFDMHHFKYGDRPRFRSCERKMAEYEAASRMHRGMDARTCYKLNPADTSPESTWLPLYHLLSIMKFNAHGVSLAPADEAQLEQIQRALPPGAPELSMWATFALASKAAHSCVPNCLWTTRNPYGAMSYFAAQPIAAGDLITISYFGNSDEPTLERWEEMARAKDFICACALCAGPDTTCGVKCLCCADGVAAPTFAPPPPGAREVPGMEAATWRCDACGQAPEAARLAAQLAEAQRMEARVRETAAQARTGRQLYEGGARELKALEALLRRARRELCGTHSVALFAAREVQLLQGVLARLARSNGDTAAAERRGKVAAAFGMMRMRLVECAAAGCYWRTLQGSTWVR